MHVRLALGFLVFLFCISAASAIVITAPSQVSVRVTYVSTEAAYSNDFGLWLPHFQYLGTGHTTPTGSVFNLGTFNTGDNLIFYITTNEQTPHTYLSEGTMPDGVVHGRVQNLDGGLYQIGFEDIWGGGDRDYNDIILSVSIAPGQGPVQVPEFPTMFLPVTLIAGLLGAVYIFRTRSS